MHFLPLIQRHLRCGNLQLDLSQPQIMGILNVTPDSFSDGGLYQHKEQAVAHALQMIADGASIIDIGGESTRPNAEPVTVEQELQRVIPVIEALAPHNVVISVDTSQPEVMRAAVQAGAHIWNDVRGLSLPNAKETAAELDIPVIVMHMRGDPQTMDRANDYHHLIVDIKHELFERTSQLREAGIRDDNILIDPGFGFAKDHQQNLQLLNEIWQFHEFEYPMVVGLSRKRFIGHVLNQPDPKQRVLGSVIGHLIAVQQGVSIVRVHDVKATADALKFWQAVSSAG